MKLIKIFLLLITVSVNAQTMKLIGLPGLSAGAGFEIHPVYTNIIYATNAYGGFFVTIDSGETISPIYPAHKSNYSIIETPDYDPDIIYADITKSTDRGETWKFMPVPSLANGLSLNPVNNQSLFIKTSTSLYKSTDEGESWVQLYEFPGTPPNKSFDLLSYDVCPSDSNIMFASYWHRIWKSVDGGENWNVCFDSLEFIGGCDKVISNPVDCGSFFFKTGVYLIKSNDGGRTADTLKKFSYMIYDFKVSPFDSNRIYVIAGGLWETVDGGNSWEVINDRFPVEVTNVGRVYFSPADRNVMYAGTNEGFLRSNDGGLTWQKTTLFYVCGAFYPSTFHDNEVFASNGKYLFRTTDEGLTWLESNMQNGDRISGIRSISVNPQNSQSGLLTTSSGVLKTFNGGQSWFKIDNSDSVLSTVYHPLDSNYIYSIKYFFDGLPGSQVVWAEVSLTGYENLTEVFSEEFVRLSGFRFVPDTPNVVYLNGIDNSSAEINTYRSTDYGITGEFYKLNENISAIHPVQNNRYYSIQPVRATSDRIGKLMFSTDYGATWEEIGTSIRQYHPYASFSQVVLDPDNPDRIYVTLHNYGGVEGGLYLSGDNGDTWREINYLEGTLKMDTNVSPREMYYATDYGLNKFTDTLWAPVGINEEAGSVVKEYTLAQNYPNPFNPSTVISYALPAQSRVELKVYDILGRKVRTLINKEKPAGRYEVEFNAKELPSGVYIYKLKAGSFAASKKMLLVK